MIKALDYFSDGQIRRYLEQVVKIFSGYQYMTGMRNGQPGQLRIVPCTIAQRNSQVAHVLRNQSENTILATPAITVALQSLNIARDLNQNPTYIRKAAVTERKVVDGSYTSSPGNRYTIETLMPRFFEAKIQLDIWTSNMDQKAQLMEQILTVATPFITFQTSDNPLDWTAMTDLILEDINWSSTSIPAGDGNQIEIATLTFSTTIRINPPAKIKQQRLIEQIIVNLYQETEDENATKTINGIPIDSELIGQVIVTPGNFMVAVRDDVITLLTEEGEVQYPNGTVPEWAPLLDLYGSFRPTQSQIRLIQGTDLNGSYVSGTIQYDPDNINNLIWTADPSTLPANTLPNLTGVIDPLRTYPTGTLKAPATADTYLLLADIGPSIIWGNLRANTNDIIQFRNDSWTVIFSASATTTVQYVLNSSSGRQLRWDGSEWSMSIDADYAPGFWRLTL